MASKLKSDLLQQILREKEDEDSALVEFFESNYEFLMTVPLNRIPRRKVFEIALSFHGTEINDHQWMVFLENLEISNDNIFKYKCVSKYEKTLPIDLALYYEKNKKKFGDITKALIDIGRYDVLLKLKPFVQSILVEDTNNSSNRCKWSPAQTPTAPEIEFQQNSAISLARDVSKKLNDSDIDKGYISMPICPLSGKNTSIKVFLLYAKPESNDAIRLSQLLREAQITVATLSSLNDLTAINPLDAIYSLFKEADFIVPIVSETFLNQIHPSGHASSKSTIPSNYSEEEEDDFLNDSNNRYIYQLSLDEYVARKCLNFRVRPVMVPNMNKQRLMSDILLRNSFMLWKRVPTLISILKKNKNKFP